MRATDSGIPGGGISDGGISDGGHPLRAYGSISMAS